MLTTVVSPAVEVITLERARLQCKIDGNERDEEIKDAIASARAWMQGHLQQAIGEQELRFTFPSWCGSAELPFDINELVSVKVDGIAVTPLPTPVGRVVTMAASGAVEVQIKTGWTAATLPGPVKSSMLLIIADLVRNVQGQTSAQLYQNHAVEGLVWPFRRRLPL